MTFDSEEFSKRKEIRLLKQNRKAVILVTLTGVFAVAPLKGFAQTPTSAPPAPAASSPDAVVISFGDLKLTAREVEKILQNLPPQSRQFYASPGGRAQFSEWLVRTKLFAKEAEKRGLQNRDEVKLSLQIFRDGLLAKVMEGEFLKDIKVSDDEAQKFLAENLEKFEQAKVRRLVIRSKSTNQLYADGKPSDQLPSDEEAKAKAEDLRKKITQGADFEEMAAKFSDDSTSSGKGGDLGYVRRVNSDTATASDSADA